MELAFGKYQMQSKQFSSKMLKVSKLVFNMFRQKPIENFLKEAKKRNVAVIARGPLASGLLTGLSIKRQNFQKMITEIII